LCTPGLAAEQQSDAKPLQELASDFWAWRMRYQPFSADDIPRVEHPPGHRDWSASSIAKQRAALQEFERRWSQMDAHSWTVAQQVDYRLIGSALARVRWELDVNPRWQRDPTFYLNQSLTAILETLVRPPPFDAQRSEELLTRMADIPQIIQDGEANLRPLRPFAQLAIDALAQIRPQLMKVQQGVAPLLSASSGQEVGKKFELATQNAIAALESYQAWLRQRLDTMPADAAIGRSSYQYFLNHVALLPYTPEQLLSLSRQEWDRAVAFEAYEQQRNHGLPDLKIAANIEEQISKSRADELAIRTFLNDKGILTVPAGVPHYTIRAVPGYLEGLSDFGELDDFTGPSRLHEDSVRWASSPSPNLGYFWLATAKDPRPDMVHEGVPGHYFQMLLSWRHEDPIRRHYYDSGANEGIGFYTEEMMLQAGLFDDSPRSREIIYNFMRLRALRVEVDVKLALGLYTIPQAADYLAQHVPMDRKTAESEAAAFATVPGQAISYQVGKSQIVGFLADAKVAQASKFSLRSFHDYVWKNGNVPFALQRWEYLGLDYEIKVLDERPRSAPAHNQ
jgi:uncharacterized protein (DUF885 family)